MDTLTQLSHEHDDLRAYLGPIETAAETRDASALTERLYAAQSALTNDLDLHIAVEETSVFSAISEAVGGDLVGLFSDEHTEIKALRDSVYAHLERGEPPFELSLRLCELILAHQEREDQMLFPSARRVLIGHSTHN